MHANILEFLSEARRQGLPSVLVTNTASGEQVLYIPQYASHGGELSGRQRELANNALVTDRCRLVEENGEKFFYHPYNPPLQLIIIGAVHIAQALTLLARHCGFQVTLVDPRRAFATQQRFPDVSLVTAWPREALAQLNVNTRTAIVTLSHDPKIDDPALEIALRSPAFYIGSLGSKKTHAARLQRLAAAGIEPALCARIRGPVGVSIGAQSPQEIAVSIMAEIIKVLRVDAVAL